MPKQEENNKWKELHDFLASDQKTKLRDDIMKECGWSQDTFYRKLRNPSSLSNAERNAIAIIYNLPYNFLFPDSENVVLQRHNQ